MNPKVDFFFEKHGKWQSAYLRLRTIALDSGLTEELKWGCPCYTLNGQNIVLIHGFKEFCAFLFMKGALMKDPQNILIIQTKNVQSARQIRFTSEHEIIEQQLILSEYIQEAIAVEEKGLKVEFKKIEEYSIPEELEEILKTDPEYNNAFEALTPGRKRGYYLHFGQAKQSKTRIARIEKARSMVLKGKGYNER